MFLVVGLITVPVGVIDMYRHLWTHLMLNVLTNPVILLRPANPMSSRPTPAEKVWVVERLRENQTGIENKHFKWHQVFECLEDPQMWMLSLITISANVPNGAVSSYQATIIRGFDSDSKETAVLQLLFGIVSMVSILSAMYFAGRLDQRGISMVALLIPNALTSALIAFLPTSKSSWKTYR